MNFFKRTLELAEGVKGFTSPNPAVGCVIVKNGEIISEGKTQPPGQDHAEAMALKKAGKNAKNAEMYVSLEPCSHFGRTPPCAVKIARSGIRKVHIATVDPNPLVRGKGIEILKKAGVEVVFDYPPDILRKLVELNEDFFYSITSGKVWVSIKYAMTIDGKIATKTGDSKWISSKSSRIEVHRLRSRVDGVAVGIGTVLKDNPHLTTRLVKGRNPKRIVFDSFGRTPINSNVLNDEAKTVIISSVGVSKKFVSEVKSRGHSIYLFKDENGNLPLKESLEILKQEEGILSLMVEGGGKLIGSFFGENLVNKLIVFIAPKIFGGGVSPVEGDGVAFVKDAVQLNDAEVEKIESDLMIKGYLNFNPYEFVRDLNSKFSD